jgi:very-short-patch-repair endonuclease
MGRIGTSKQEAKRMAGRRAGKKNRSTLEHGFALLFERLTSAPAPQREYRFHPTRKWRFDFAWAAHRVAVEIDGGIFTGGGHNRGVQFARDAEKHNAAVLLGWRVLRYTTLDLRRRPVQCVREVAALLASISPAAAEPRQQPLSFLDAVHER